MESILQAFPDTMQFIGIVFAMAFTAMLMFVFALSMHKVDLSHLITSKGSNDVSHTKFWANIAYLIVTLAFLRVNFDVAYNQYLPELWLIYLGVVASNASVSKWISMRYQAKSESQQRHDSDLEH